MNILLLHIVTYKMNVTRSYLKIYYVKLKVLYYVQLLNNKCTYARM